MKPIYRFILVLLLSTLACQTLIPSAKNNAFEIQRLITVDEINSISGDIGVIDWKLIDVANGENQLRHTFQGTSWSSSPNEALNGIIKVYDGSSFEDIITSMLDSGLLFPGTVEVNSSLTFQEEFGVYASSAPNGHCAYDLLILKDDLVYWASVTLGTQVGVTPEMLYQEYGAAIDTFLYKMVMINFSR